MHIYFRTDGNEVIATGHVMRCLSIADACKENGHEAIFITADDQCGELIQQRGYNYINLFGKWDDLEYELTNLEHLINTQSIQMLLIDSYYVTEKYLERLKCLTKTIYIDDLNSFHYSVDMLINYSIYADKFMYSTRYNNTKLLLGCKYVPLRTQFRNIGKKVIHKQVRNILITSGGTDNQNIVGHLLKSILHDVDFEHIFFHVVTGVFNSNLLELRTLEKKNDSLSIHCNVLDMAALMMNADVAISAGGSTLYELSACGVPTVTYSFADNQLDNVNEFDKKGLMEYAGDTRIDINVCINSIIRIVKNYINCNSVEKREKCSNRLQQLVDGKGCMRIVEAYCSKIENEN